MTELVLRAATETDADLLRDWRNEPATRAASRSTGEVTTDEHRSWLQSVLADPDRLLWVAELGARPAGQVRFDRIRGYVYEISVSIDPAMRGGGLGSELIARGCEALYARTNATSVVARVRPENEASLRAFAANGFAPVTEEQGFAVLAMARPDEWAPWPRSAVAGG